MATDEPVNRSETALQQLFGVWDSRSEMYGRVHYGCALGLHSGHWKNVITFILPLHKIEARKDIGKAEYAELIVSSGVFTLEEAKTCLRHVIVNNELSMPGLPAASIRADLSPETQRFCASSHSQFPLLFPSFEYDFGVMSDYRTGPPQRTLYGLGLPVFPEGWLAVQDRLTLRGGGQMTYHGQLVAIVPDYRARIGQIRLSSKGMELSAESSQGYDPRDLIAKVYYESASGISQHADLTFANGKARLEADEYPERLTVVLMSKERQDRIDERNFHFGHRYGLASSGIDFDSDEFEIENLISAGESDQVEFKKQLPEPDSFAKEMVAFANSSGGQIFIGVDDDARIVGCDLANIYDRITNIMRAYCDPPLQITFKDVLIREKRIVIVTVHEGQDKPYTVRDSGVWLRSKGTKRTASRYELDQMYRDRGSLRTRF